MGADQTMDKEQYESAKIVWIQEIQIEWQMQQLALVELAEAPADILSAFFV